jgi:hypothetical protein
MVYEWIERFKNGRTSIKHEEGARRIVQVYDTKLMTGKDFQGPICTTTVGVK